MSNLHYLSENLKQAAYCLPWDQRDKRVSPKVLPLSCCYSFSLSPIHLFPTGPELGELDSREKKCTRSTENRANGRLCFSILQCQGLELHPGEPPTIRVHPNETHVHLSRLFLSLDSEKLRALHLIFLKESNLKRYHLSRSCFHVVNKWPH